MPATRSVTDAVRPVRLWFAPPQAADSVDPAALAGIARDDFARLGSERRRRDWRAAHALDLVAGAARDDACSRSHSRGLAALAIAAAPAVLGLDLEALAPRAFVDLAAIAYAPEETEWLRSLAEPAAQCAAFYELWTLKEACVKALQIPLIDALRRCRFVDAQGRWGADLPLTGPWRAVVYAPRPQWRLACLHVGSSGAADAPLASLHEWPGRAADWPLVRDFGGSGSPPGRAC